MGFRLMDGRMNEYQNIKTCHQNPVVNSARRITRSIGIGSRIITRSFSSTKITRNNSSSVGLISQSQRKPYTCNVRKIKNVKKKKNEVRRGVPLPLGVELTKLANIDIHAEDFGHALHLVHFCQSFEEVLSLEKGLAETLLKELACGGSEYKKCDSSVVEFHIKLLSLVQEYPGKYSTLCENYNTWLEAFKRCILKSQNPSKKQMLDFLNTGPGAYEELNFAKKLRLLTFLCDETLGTPELRSWIVKQQEEFNKAKKKAARERVRDGKIKAKYTENKLQDEVVVALAVQRNGAPLSISKQPELKDVAPQAVTKTLEGSDAEMMKERGSDVRLEPILVDANGHIFWKSSGCFGGSDILLQEIHKEGQFTYEEKWFTYEVDEIPLLENYLLHQQRNTDNGEEKFSASW